MNSLYSSLSEESNNGEIIPTNFILLTKEFQTPVFLSSR